MRRKERLLTPGNGASTPRLQISSSTNAATFLMLTLLGSTCSAPYTPEKKLESTKYLYPKRNAFRCCPALQRSMLFLLAMANRSYTQLLPAVKSRFTATLGAT